MLKLYSSFAVSGPITIAMYCWLVGWLVAGQSQAADWPMWRYDSSRSAASTDQLPSQLAPLWSTAIGARRPAWDDTLNRDLMSYDRLLEPIVKDGRMFVGLNDRDQLVAYSAADGKWLWSYYCDGPVRLPPVAWQNFVYCASDDGFLHCVDAVTGKLNWKFRGGPINATQLSTASTSGQNAVAGHGVTLGRLSLGNQRLISAWPARGGPVLRDGQIYFTASIWPFMGTFIYALDAQTGRTLWVNDETGAQYIRQPHSAPAFAGVAPQGALVATEKALIVPGGRSVPAVFERETGKMRYFELNAAGKGTGGSFVAANESSWFVHTRERGTREFALDTGLKTAFMPNEPVLSGETIYAAVDADGQRFIRAYHSQTKDVQWETPVDALGDLIQASQHLVAASSSVDGQSTISLVRLPSAGQAAKIVASRTIAGTVQRLLAADGQVLAVTLEGTIHALGAPRATGTTSSPVDSLAETEPKNKVKRLEVDPDTARRATSLLAAGEAV
ncbi:MAG: PQQ-binding-like beta-propeller repeat protein, partial [Pirellulaceae bacterium]|nr:PQQ-binding-like beta-propeller repeat protein [Pirellulaceae bacterium]